ncbi:MAG: hypothetical protein APR54_06770 [Candidatus Cloacimonas sp. SDB]|nr:MAG: hypothetical protein APR54_06770 [Candidatus Cloacimonas sp. SDB]
MIILTIPYFNETFALSQFKKYQHSFPWIEFRLDYSSQLKNIPTDIITPKTIFTYRDSSEGGVGNLNFKDKIEYLKDLAKSYNSLIDLELESYEKNVLPSENLLLSYHDLGNECDLDKLEKIIQKANSISAKYLKIAVPINSYSNLIQLRNLISASQKPVILAGLGTLSRQIRILHKHLGAIGTFAGLNDHKVMTDQLSVDEIFLYRLQKITQKTKITGLVGKNQVANSLGISFYNKLYQDKDLDAVYLPFPVGNFSDFWNWIQFNKTSIAGLSITMPFKKEICKFTNCNNAVGNLYLADRKQVLNTDLTAFKKSIFTLQISQSDKILMLGSGATAETALFAFKAFKNVNISGRNQTTALELEHKYNCSFIPSHDLQSYEFDVFVNCTPLGMKGENPLDIYQINLPEKVIDLPYRTKNTPLINNCRQKHIACVDGLTFWQWQAKQQIEGFVRCISLKPR